jgi:hypothetical protein
MFVPVASTRRDQSEGTFDHEIAGNWKNRVFGGEKTPAAHGPN